MTVVALVTGAEDRLGKEIARALASSGYSVWLHHRGNLPDKIHSFLDEAASKRWNVHPVEADLLQLDQIDRMFETIAKNGGLDVLVNNASLFFPSRLDQVTPAQWDLLFQTNVKAVWWCAIQASKIMKNDRSGCIINLADSGAYQRWVHYGAYSLSRSCVLELTVLLAKTLAPNIRVNSISPGLILADADTNSERWAELIQKTLLKKDGSAADLIKAVWFLIENNHITGIDIPVDGGYRWK